MRGWWLLAGLLACAVQASITEYTPVVATPVQRPMAARAVHHDDFARTVLYTWTTAAQVEALRSSRQLLVAEAGAGTGPSQFVHALAELKQRHAIAGLLLEHPDLRRRRYAWTSPFATTLGLGPVRYGDSLVRIELKPGAVIVRFRPSDAVPFVAVDTDGRVVALEDVDAGRIAAVYHVRDGPRDAVAFREYVVCNEAQIAAWSVATPEIQQQVDADIGLLEGLLDGPLAWLPEAAVQSSAALAWPTARVVGTPLDRWHASLAFDNHRYQPRPGNFLAIVEALRDYAGGGAPLVHRPQGSSVGQASR